MYDSDRPTKLHSLLYIINAYFEYKLFISKYLFIT